MTKYRILKPGQDPTTEEIPRDPPNLIMVIAVLMILLAVSIVGLVIIMAIQGVI